MACWCFTRQSDVLKLFLSCATLKQKLNYLQRLVLRIQVFCCLANETRKGLFWPVVAWNLLENVRTVLSWYVAHPGLTYCRFVILPHQIIWRQVLGFLWVHEQCRLDVYAVGKASSNASSQPPGGRSSAALSHHGGKICILASRMNFRRVKYIIVAAWLEPCGDGLF